VTYIIILLVAGVLLAFLETFIPSGGVLAVLAAGSLVGAVALGFMQSSDVGCIVSIAVIVCVPIIVVIGLKLLPRTPFGRRMLLAGPKRDFAASGGTGRMSPEDYGNLTGKSGIVVAALRPAGIAEIDGKRRGVTADGQMVDAGCEIVVVRVEGNNIIVRPKNS
jgi:membrane-bound serine protease (ClpP class)